MARARAVRLSMHAMPPERGGRNGGSPPDHGADRHTLSLLDPRATLSPLGCRGAMSNVTALGLRESCPGSGQLDEYLADDALLHGVMGGGDLFQREAMRR